MLFFFLSFVPVALCYLSAAPEWLTSTYFRANNEDVIATLTGSSSTPTYKFTFSSALPGVPNLAYGIKNYMGNDYMGQQIWEIRRVALTASTFTVSVQIYGVTNIYRLNVPYIAIDPQFPHHLNSFDNVPVNYNAGALINITSKSTTQVNTYTNVINYTLQSAGRTFTKFKLPLENNKILLFICALEIYSTNEGSSLPWYPIDYHVQPTVLSETTYQLRVTLSNKTQIDWLHFSEIIFDQADVQSSKKYYIVTQKREIPQKGQFIPLPEEFMDNFIMGLLDFSTVRGHSVLHYNWEFETQNGVFGVAINESIPYPHLVQSALSRMGTMIFYMKTWQCPLGYDYFNLTSNLCQDMCGDYTYENNTEYECQYCNYSCQDCTSGHDCIVCDEVNDHRTLFNGVACECMENYYEDPVTTVCQHCSNFLSNCADCFYNSTYKASDASAGAIQFGCFECDQGYFLQNLACHPPATCTGATVLNIETNQCDPCLLEGCLQCQSHTVCTQCDVVNEFFLVSQTSQCKKCPVLGCQTCAAIDKCAVCKDTFTFHQGTCFCQKGTYYDESAELCLECSPYCLYCNGGTSFHCEDCFLDQQRVLIGTTCVCDEYNYKEPESGQVCVKKDVKKCNRGYIKIETTGQCVEICGDGVLLERDCDDGNIINGDGCSDKCKVEPYFVCSSQEMRTSACKLETVVDVVDIKVLKVPEQNKLTLELDISPITDAYQSYELGQIFEFDHPGITIDTASYADGKLIIETSYTEDLEGKDIGLSLKEDALFVPGHPDDPNAEDIYTTSKVTFKLSSTFLPIKTDNNLDAYYYPEEVYEEAKKVESAAVAVSATSLTSGFFCIVLKSSLPMVMMMSSLQLVFFSLVTIDGMHPAAQALIHLKATTGYHDPSLASNSQVKVGNTRVGSSEDSSIETDPTLNRRLDSLGYDTSFANNYNVMLFVQVGLLCVTGLVYLVSQKRSIMKTPFKFFQQFSFMFMLFNINGFLFSMSLIRVSGFLNICFAAVGTIIVLGFLIHFLLYGPTYFGMYMIFDFTRIYFKTFIIGFFILRVAVCFSISLIEHDPLMGCIAAMAASACSVIFLAVIRPFISMLTNGLFITTQLLALGAFASIYVLEGLEGSESTGAWVLLGIACGITVLIFVQIVHGIYTVCTFSQKVSKISPEKFDNLNDISPEASKSNLNE